MPLKRASLLLDVRAMSQLVLAWSGQMGDVEINEISYAPPSFLHTCFREGGALAPALHVTALELALQKGQGGHAGTPICFF